MSIPACMERYNCKSCLMTCPNFDIRTAKYLPEDKWPTKWTVDKFNTCYKCAHFGKDCPNKPFESWEKWTVCGCSDFVDKVNDCAKELAEPEPEPPHRSWRDLQRPIIKEDIQPLKWSILDRMKECVDKGFSTELLNYTNAFDILNRTYPDLEDACTVYADSTIYAEKKGAKD